MEVLKKYKELAASCPNITFHESGLVDAKLLNSADVLLSDASSVIVVYNTADGNRGIPDG